MTVVNSVIKYLDLSKIPWSIFSLLNFEKDKMITHFLNEDWHTGEDTSFWCGMHKVKGTNVYKFLTSLWLLIQGITNDHQALVGKIWLRDTLVQRSPTFLAPGTSFVEYSFSMDWAGGWFWDDSSAFDLLCSLFLFCGNLRIFHLNFWVKVHAPMRIQCCHWSDRRQSSGYMQAMGKSYKHWLSFACSPATYLLQYCPVPNRT